MSTEAIALLTKIKEQMTDGPHCKDGESPWIPGCVAKPLLEEIEAFLTDAEQPELITVEASLRFRLECEQEKSEQLLQENRELQGKIDAAEKAKKG